MCRWPGFNSIDSFISIISVPGLFALWRWQDKRGGEPNEILQDRDRRLYRRGRESTAGRGLPGMDAGSSAGACRL